VSGLISCKVHVLHNPHLIMPPRRAGSNDDDNDNPPPPAPPTAEEVRQAQAVAQGQIPVNFLAQMHDALLHTIANQLNDTIIYNLCRTSKELNRKLCQTPMFWLKRIVQYLRLENLTLPQLRRAVGTYAGTEQKLWTSLRRFYHIRGEVERLRATVPVPDAAFAVANFLLGSLKDLVSRNDYTAVYLLFEQRVVPEQLGFFKWHDFAEIVFKFAMRSDHPWFLNIISDYFDVRPQNQNYRSFMREEASDDAFRYVAQFLSTKPLWAKARGLIMNMAPTAFEAPHSSTGVSGGGGSSSSSSSSTSGKR